MKAVLKASLIAGAMATVFAGCATKSLLEKNSGGTYTTTERQTLVSDRVLAFGTPATYLPNVTGNPVVIVGEKHSYVLTEGGQVFLQLLPRLDAKYINLTDRLDFYSKNNDGMFTGRLAFKYTKLKIEVTNAEKNLFLQYDVRECTTSSTERMDAQSFCFDIPLAGMVYPAVTNSASLHKLSKIYPVSIYTEVKKQQYRHGDTNPLQKVVLLPFAVAFDVITLPFQALNKIFD